MRKPSPSILVSSAALLVALGGTSYAALSIDGKDINKNSITGKQIKNKTIKSKDIDNGGIKGKDLRDGVIPEGARWALIDRNGAIVASSGGFTVAAAYPTLAATATDPGGLRANGNVYINAGESLNNNAITATIVLQNLVDQNGDSITSGRAPGADDNPEFSGEIAVSQCGTTATICGPPGTNSINFFVVSPRLSNGSFTDTTNRKSFYVVITGDSSDRTS